MENREKKSLRNIIEFEIVNDVVLKSVIYVFFVPPSNLQKRNQNKNMDGRQTTWKIKQLEPPLESVDNYFKKTTKKNGRLMNKERKRNGNF